MSTESNASDKAIAVVLIVEDEEPIALALSFIVEDEGYTALIATRGKEALEILRERSAALVITDLMMPQMSGQALIAAIRQDAKADHRHTPVVLMTAAGPEFVANMGADAILLKPFDIGTVTSLLHKFLD